MAIKSLYLAAAFAAVAIGVNAQAAPNWAYIPTACENQCAQTIQSSYLCSQQHQGDSLATYGCFCSDYPSDAAGCATCLNSNNAAALGSLLTSTQTACPTAQKQCFFSCSFDTCPSSDVACQCSARYLSDIYNCASCNDRNDNTGATGLADFRSLNASCGAQNYTGAAQSFSTAPLPAATNKGAYQKPALTATGGGLAATGSVAALGAVTDSASGAASASASTGNTRPTTVSGAGSQSASIRSASASGSSASGASRSASGVASSVSSGAAAATSSRSSAGNVLAPAGGVLALVGAVFAVL